MAELRIRVAAAVDRNLSTAYQPLVEAAERARRAIAESARKAGTSVRTGTRAGTDAAEKEFAKLARQTERWQKQGVRAVEAAERAKQRAVEAAARAEVAAATKAARERARAELAAHRAVDRELAAGNRLRERELRRNERSTALRNRRALNFGVQGAASVGRAALGIVGEVARGAGVNIDIGRHITSSVDLEKRAVDLSNAAYMPGKSGPNGQRQDPRALIAQVRQVGDATAMDPNAAMEGLQKFVAKTGDLETGRAVIGDMAKLARASGAELDDIVDAAGDVAQAFDGAEDKGARVREVMKAIAAQGKEGAVEIKNLATQMAKLSAASSTFSGDRSLVMAQMGALAQMARSKGGASSATQAATSVGSFTNTFSKKARLDALKAFGVDFRTADGRVDAKKAILGAIAAASSDKHGGMSQFDMNMGKMFMDVRARSVTRGFETVFKEHGGGAEGLKAAEKAFDDLVRATMDDKEVNESFARSMETTEAKVQAFNNQMSRTADDLKTALLPAFQALAPAVVDVANTIVGFLGKLTGSKDVQGQKDEFATKVDAINAKGTILAGVQRGELTNAETGEAVKAGKALDEAIAKKEKQVAEEKKMGTGKEQSEETIKKLADGPKGGNPFAKRYFDDKQGLEDMKQIREDLRAAMQEADTKRDVGLLRYLEGATLNVKVVEGPVTTPTSGRDPEPEHRPR